MMLVILTIKLGYDYRVVETSYPDVKGSARGDGTRVAGQQDSNSISELNVPEI
jgi:hypothetical protein